MNSNVLPPPLPNSLPSHKLVGITTTVPVEVIYAAGLVPVDLNNLFISSPDPAQMVGRAEHSGFPRTCCCWIKGLYGAAHHFDVPTIVGVVRGDCSNTEALMEVLASEGRRCISFAYPLEPDEAAMGRALRGFADELGVSLEEAGLWRRKLEGPRRMAARIDALSWQECRVSGRENHLWLVSASDFCGSPRAYEQKAKRMIEAAVRRKPLSPDIRLGYVGVPPIVDGIYEYMESQNALVTYNETQHQFAMCEPWGSLCRQYTRYTYPYGMRRRVEAIRKECRRRSLDGIVHYVQSFCFRRVEDRLLRERLDLPVLTLECDRPGPLSRQMETRLEAFVQTLDARKRGRSLF